MTTLDVSAARPLMRLGTALRAAPLAPRLRPPAAVCLLALIELGAGQLGLWWVTALLGIAVGAAAMRRGVRVLLAATVLGWVGGILLQSGSRTFEIGGVVSAEVFNARGLGWLILVVAVVYACLLVLAGAWAGAAGRRVFAEPRSEIEAAAPAALATAEREEAGNV